MSSECCRCCLSEDEPGDMVYVFDVLDEFEARICDLIQRCGGIEITEEDAYSKSICGNCLNDLANAARFRERCAKTEQVLLSASVMVFEQQDEDELPDSSGLVKVEVEDDQSTRDSDPAVEFIIAEDPNDPELAKFDYDQLISSQDSDPPDEEPVLYSKVVKVRDKTVEKVVRPRPASQLNFVCQECGARFALQKNLAKHMVTHQSFVCELCMKPFEIEADLLAHMTLSHNQDQGPSDAATNADSKKKHKCEFCGKPFISNSALTAHIRVHTKERPFPCSYCPKRFSTVGSQELHERRHNGIKPYKCDTCGRGFAESSNLKVHLLTHTKEKNHVCTICNRAFARVFLLKIHQRTHTGERPFPCPECGKTFAQQGDLAAHRRIHSGIRPYRCDICGKEFIKSSGLDKHRRRHKEVLLVEEGGAPKGSEDLIVEGCEEELVEEDCGDDEVIFETIIVKG